MRRLHLAAMALPWQQLAAHRVPSLGQGLGLVVLGLGSTGPGTGPGPGTWSAIAWS
jgi:hypothetical protein